MLSRERRWDRKDQDRQREVNKKEESLKSENKEEKLFVFRAIDDNEEEKNPDDAVCSEDVKTPQMH